MKVILNQDVKGTGKKGEMVEVSDGYARNYMLPRKIASEVTPQLLNDLKNQEKARQHHLEAEREKAQSAAKTLDGRTVKVTAKAGQGGKLFGAVTSKEIAERISKDFNMSVDKKKIVLHDDIKTYGTYECEVKLYSGISAKLYVLVGEEQL